MLFDSNLRVFYSDSRFFILFFIFIYFEEIFYYKDIYLEPLLLYFTTNDEYN